MSSVGTRTALVAGGHRGIGLAVARGHGAPRSPDEGADAAVWLATIAEDAPTGGFFRDRTPIAW